MSVLERYLRSAHRRLDALRNDAQEEAWKIDYREAEGCHFFELALSDALGVLQYIREIEKSWRTAVYRGIDRLSEGKDGWMSEGYSRWLDLAEVMEKSVRHFEERGYHIAQAEEFREAVKVTKQTLANWVPPLPSRSPAMLAEEITEAEADELRTILNAPAGSTGKLKTTPLLLPDGDPSLLR
jgi:hypothetical protein